MNRRSRHLLVLTVAVVTATIASVAIYRAMLHGMPGRRTREKQRSSWRHPMAIGTSSPSADLKVVSWPAGSPIRRRRRHHETP